jgi:hypothetical protein
MPGGATKLDIVEEKIVTYPYPKFVLGGFLRRIILIVDLALRAE